MRKRIQRTDSESGKFEVFYGRRGKQFYWFTGTVSPLFSLVGVEVRDALGNADSTVLKWEKVVREPILIDRMLRACRIEVDVEEVALLMVACGLPKTIQNMKWDD